MWDGNPSPALRRLPPAGASLSCAVGAVGAVALWVLLVVVDVGVVRAVVVVGVGLLGLLGRTALEPPLHTSLTRPLLLQGQMLPAST